MIGIIIGLYFLALSIVAFLKTRKIFAPIFITPFLWAIMLILFNILPHDLYPIQAQFYVGITVWVTSFYTAAMLISASNLQNLNLYNNRVNINLLKFLLILTFILAILLIFFLIREALNGQTDLFFLNLREINTGAVETERSIGPLIYAFNLAYIFFLIKVLEYSKTKAYDKFHLILFLTLNITLSILTVARTSFFYLFVSTFIVLLFKGQVKAKHYIYSISCILTLMIGISVWKSLGSDDSTLSLLAETLQVYVFSPMPAFDKLVPDSELFWGANTFRFFYAICSSLGVDLPVNKTLYEWTNVPYPTNVYTVMYPFYKDFGFFGVFSFGFIYGLIFQTICKLAEGKNKIFILIYAVTCPMLLLQFFGEYFFTNFSSTLQLIFLCSLPYLFRIKLWG